MIAVKNLKFGYMESPLYEEVNFVVGTNQKVGLAGPNGSGKSTLLKILSGNEDGYSGVVKVIGKIASVPQEVKHDPIMEASTSARIYVDPENKYEDHEILKLFKGLELSVDLLANPQKFSGGQKTKLALARALLQKPDVLFLDEPTNFMDTAGKRWVMDFLSKYDGAVIVISHDLSLMDRAIEKVFFVNPATKRVEEYKGTYSDYVRLKKEKEETLKKQIIVKQKHIKQMEEGLRKMARFTSAKGVRARVRQQKRIEKEKAALPDLPPEIRSMKVALPEPVRVGEMPLKVTGLKKSYGDLDVLKNVNFTILRGDRIALIGPNGVGKSTFIKSLMGLVTPDSGEIVKNPNLQIGYYSQEFETFDFEKTVIDTFIDKTERDERFARAFLGRYMFMGEKVFQRVETLSGGEKTRLSIASLTGVGNNLLILDEPTTYLDVLSQRIILEALKDYQGTMIFVSHTPEFVRELKPNKAYLFPEEKMVFWDDDLLPQVEEI